jgi:multiple sugar transport system substrate-binding protein
VLLFSLLVMPAAGAEKTKLVYWLMSSEDFIKPAKELTNQYMKENPNIEIELQTYPWADYPTKMAAVFSAGGVPDVMEASSLWTRPYILGDNFDPVPDSVFTKNQFADRYFPSTQAMVTFKNRFWGLPINVDSSGPPMLLVNDKLVSEAGVNIDSVKTWGELIKDWQALTVKDASGKVTRAGLGTACYQPPYLFGSYLMEFGGSMLDKTGHKAALNSSAGRKALQLLADYHKKYKIDNVEITDMSSVANGLAATVIWGPWIIPILERDFPNFKWHYVSIPYPEGSTQQVWLGGSGWALFVPKQSANKEEAWKLVKYMDAHRKQQVASTHEMPAQRKLAAELAVENPKLYKSMYKVIDQSRFDWSYGDFFKIYDILQNMVMSVWLDQATVDSALTKAESEINTHLDQWWGRYGQYLQ